MKSTFARRTLALTVAGCLLSGTALAADIKLGYVNPERVYTETQAAQRIERTLQAEFGQQQQKLAAMQQAGIQLQQQVQSGKLRGAAQRNAENKLLEASREYRIAATRLAEEYSLRRNEEFASLQRNANDIIKNIAETEKYDFIVQEAVFVNGKYDITDRVIKLLDAIQ